MAPAKKRAGKGKQAGERDPEEVISTLLRRALHERRDFVIAFEREAENSGPAHVLSGLLITPCMLGTLANRTDQQADEGACHLVLDVPAR
jgi:hypothetical protein